MSAHIMTAFAAKKDGPGSREIKATFRGPGLVAPETGYDVGGSVLDLTSKPAAAAPVADAASTSPMLYNVARLVKAEPSTAALAALWRARYVPAAAGAPATGLMQVFGPAAVVTEVAFDFTDLAAAAVTNQVTVIPVIGPGTRVVGAEIEITIPFADGTATITTLTLDIGEPVVDADGIVNSGALFGAAAGTIDNTTGALANVGMWQPIVNGTIEVEATADANLNNLTAGAAIARVWTIDNDAFGDPATWGEVAAGTDLSGLTIQVEATGG